MLPARTVIILLISFSVVSGSYITAEPAPSVSSNSAEFSVALEDTTDWPRPRFEERKEERHQMVDQALKGKEISDSLVLQALRHVPRHLFIPEKLRPFAYMNRPLPIGHDQTISQPFIVGYMTQMLHIEAGDNVLEIGTGSGYQAAVLAELTPHVFTIEIVRELGQQARERFEELGYTTIQTRIGDGYQGWKEHAPFDAIILTAAPEEIPDPLVNQLKAGGTMVIPVGKTNQTQILTRVVKDESGEVTVERKLPVRFVPMTGGSQETDHQ